MSNIINLADRRKFVQASDKDAAIEKLFPPHLQQGIANTRLEYLHAVADHERLLMKLKSFRPSTMPALENAALAPLLNLRFNNTKLRDLFVPLRSQLHAAEYEKLYRRFAIGFRIGSMTEPTSRYFDLWVNFGEDRRFTQPIRKAYEQAGIDWIDAIVSAAVELKVQNDPPEYPMPEFEGRALLRLPRKAG